MKRKTKGDVEYYTSKRRKPILYSTTSALDSLKIWSEIWPVPLYELRKKISSLVGVYEEKKILDQLIEKGFGDAIFMLK